MKNLMQERFVVLFWIGFLVFGHSQATQWECSWTFGNYFYDLTSRSSSDGDGSPWLGFDSGGTPYYFFLCDPVSGFSGCSNESQVCQMVLPGSSISCGIGPPTDTQIGPGEGVAMNTTNGDYCPLVNSDRTTVVNARCPDRQHSDSTIVVNENPTCNYKIDIYLTEACGTPLVPVPTPTPRHLPPSPPPLDDYVGPSLQSYAVFEQMEIFDPPVVPYQYPSLPPKSSQEIQELGYEYFSPDINSTDLALALYDWSQPDYSRINAQLIFPQFYKDFQGFYDVQKNYVQCSQLGLKGSCSRETIYRYRGLNLLWNNAQTEIMKWALKRLDGNQSNEISALYRGGVEFGSAIVCAQFQEFYNDTQPKYEKEPWQDYSLPLSECIDQYFNAGSKITIRTFWSTSLSENIAHNFNHGIIYTISPPPQDQNWGAKSIIPFAIDPTNIEYLYPPGQTFEVVNVTFVNNYYNVHLCDTTCS